MAEERTNERLRAAIRQKGLDPDQLSVLVQVDVKTVYRWLAGRTPLPRLRAQVASALEREERELWPEVAINVPAEDPQREIQGAWPHTNDYRAPDWRVMMRDAAEQIDMLDYTLIDIVSASGIIDMLKDKAAAGCQVRALIAAPDSIWVASAAKQLGQDEQDYVGRTELQREIELARGHLEPLIGSPGIELRAFYAERYATILRFDEQMLVTLHLWGTPTQHAPLLHLRRRGDAGMFDQFAAHLDAIIQEASELLETNPDHYPDPNKNPDRYRAMTKDAYQQQKREVDWNLPKPTPPKRPSEESRDELQSYLDGLSDRRSE